MGRIMPGQPVTPAQLPPLPTSGGTYELSQDGRSWIRTQFTAPAGSEPTPTPAPEPVSQSETSANASPVLGQDSAPGET